MVQDYGVAQGLDEDNLETFHLTIETMDRAWLEWDAERRKAEQDAARDK